MPRSCSWCNKSSHVLRVECLTIKYASDIELMSFIFLAVNTHLNYIPTEKMRIDSHEKVYKNMWESVVWESNPVALDSALFIMSFVSRPVIAVVKTSSAPSRCLLVLFSAFIRP